MLASLQMRAAVALFLSLPLPRFPVDLVSRTRGLFAAVVDSASVVSARLSQLLASRQAAFAPIAWNCLPQELGQRLVCPIEGWDRRWLLRLLALRLCPETRGRLLASGEASSWRVAPVALVAAAFAARGLGRSARLGFRHWVALPPL